jgi:hypothetical protein
VIWLRSIFQNERQMNWAKNGSIPKKQNYNEHWSKQVDDDGKKFQLKVNLIFLGNQWEIWREGHEPWGIARLWENGCNKNVIIKLSIYTIYSSFYIPRNYCIAMLLLWTNPRENRNSST